MRVRAAYGSESRNRQTRCEEPAAPDGNAEREAALALTACASIHTLAGVARKYRFNVMIEPDRLRLLRVIAERTGATPSEQIRRAIDAYLETQTALTKSEVTDALKPRK